MTAPGIPPLRRDDALRALFTARLSAWPVLEPEPPPGVATLHRAAVALAVTDAGHGMGVDHEITLPAHADWQHDAALILTRRAAGLRRHAGQWALPGGRMDDGETPEQTALRELAEEVGLHLSPADILGRLDSFVTRSGFAITPVVVWAGDARGMVPNPAEVASVHRIPVTELLRDDAPILEHQVGSDQPVLKMPVGGSWIAAPTAALLYQFREVCVLDRATRVAHYEQPHFAWK